MIYHQRVTRKKRLK